MTRCTAVNRKQKSIQRLTTFRRKHHSVSKQRGKCQRYRSATSCIKPVDSGMQYIQKDFSGRQHARHQEDFGECPRLSQCLAHQIASPHYCTKSQKQRSTQLMRALLNPTEYQPALSTCTHPSCNTPYPLDFQLDATHICLTYCSPEWTDTLDS